MSQNTPLVYLKDPVLQEALKREVPVEESAIAPEFLVRSETMALDAAGPGSRPGRTRYRYDPERGEVVPISADYVDRERRAQTPTEELIYGGLQATDGTDISSRRKHREYMAQNGLTTVDDFQQEWAKKQQERENSRAGQWTPAMERELQSDIGRASYQLIERDRKRRDRRR